MYETYIENYELLQNTIALKMCPSSKKDQKTVRNVIPMTVLLPFSKLILPTELNWSLDKRKYVLYLSNTYSGITEISPTLVAFKQKYLISPTFSSKLQSGFSISEGLFTLSFFTGYPISF